MAAICKVKSNGYYNKLADSGQSNGEWACVGRFTESPHLLMDLMCALCWPAISCHTPCLDRVGGKLEINLPHAQIHPYEQFVKITIFMDRNLPLSYLLLTPNQKVVGMENSNDSLKIQLINHGKTPRETKKLEKF